MRNCVCLKIIVVLLLFVTNTTCNANGNYTIEKDTIVTKKHSNKKSSSLKTVSTTPTITAKSNLEPYCPISYTKIVSEATLSDPGNVITEIYIQISTGYINGQDQLILTNVSSHSKIGISPFDPSTGKLRLFRIDLTATSADFKAAIEDVVFYNSSTSPTGTREFSITMGQANYLPRNKHFYEYVSAPGITWTAAKAAAETRSPYYGLQGYLATLTAADEAQLSGAQASGAGWIGGTDEAQEGTWKWVTGPEGLANGGTGTIFWIGTGSGSSPINFAYWNKLSNEPNNAGNEDYAHITDPLLPGAARGSWNDLDIDGSSGYYFPQGYIVEYGDMVAGDVDNIQISASTTLKIAKITTTTPSPICAGATSTLQASSTTGTINWFDVATNGVSLGIGNNFITPPLFATTNYYIDNGCSTRTQVIATVKPLTSTLSVSNISYCQNDIATALNVTPSANCTLNWYTSPTGGTASPTLPIPDTTTAGITSYFVSQTAAASGCEGPRSEIKVTVNPLPIAPLVSDVFYCQNESAVSLTAIACSNCNLNWYPTATGGVSSSTSPTSTTSIIGTTLYYVSQTITATACEGSRSLITVTVNPLPQAPMVNDISFCLNETALPLTAVVDANCTLNWYTAAIGGMASTTNPIPSTATKGFSTYFVSQTISASGCEGPRSEIKVTVNPLPIINVVTIVQCDSDSTPDGKTYFNLTVNNDLISANFNNENFTYYTSPTGANSGISTDLITNYLAFENTIANEMSVWARVADKTTGCYSVAEITLKVPSTNLLPSYKIPTFIVCDDFLDITNNNRDGIATFDFSSSKAIILAKLANQSYIINYYRNKNDALAELNAISDISNYRNIDYPNSQDIWVRIESNLNNECISLGPYITLKVEALPIANPVIIPRQCDDNQDGIFTFDTSTVEATLLNGQSYSNVSVTYFDQNGSTLPSPFPATFTTTSKTIKAILTNKSPLNCYDETLITFTVDDAPEAIAIAPTLTTVCDDEMDPLDQDGKFTFETSTFEAIILGTQTGMTVTYTLEDGTVLSTLAPTFKTGTQNVLVTVTNPINPLCSATTTLNFVVHPLPKINLNTNGTEDEWVCDNLPNYFVTLSAEIQDGSLTSNYDYIWKKDGNPVGTNLSTLDVYSEGVYTVEVTNKSFGCRRTRTITVRPSNSATIMPFKIIDLVDINSVTVMATGPGEYEYSLDEPSGPWQSSTFFDNVSSGIHDVYINDKNGCGSVKETIAVIGASKFFTPNNDGYNDYWSIEGINGTFNSKSTIYIFDRYGKLLKQWIPSLNLGWDGTFNGIPLPADDYWFTLKLENGREAKGHFSLKR